MRWRGWHSLSWRLLVLSLGGTLLGLVLVGVVIATLLRDFVVETYEANLDATLVALMANTEFLEATSQVRVNAAVADPRYEQPFSGWYWQIGETDAVLIRSGSLWTSSIALTEGEMLASGAQRSFAAGPRGETLRVLWRSFSGPGSTVPLVVAVAMPEAEISTRINSVVWPLVASLAVLAVALILAALVQVRFGLVPLKRLAGHLQAIHRGDMLVLPEERTTEIAPVVREMNALLVANRETIGRARTHVGNLAHGLKTPLAVLGTELEDPAVPADVRGRLHGLAERMNRMVSHHLRRARLAGGADVVGLRTPVAAALADLQPVFAGIYADRQLVLTVDCPTELVFAGEREDLDELLGNLIDNACKWAEGQVEVAARRSGAGRLTVSVADDGPGMSADQAQDAVAWGKRFDEGRPGAGLGLAIVADLARLYGGGLRFAARDDGGHGAVAVLELPAAE